MPLSSSAFGLVRGNKLYNYESRANTNAKYTYIKSFTIGNYKTTGESVIVTYLTNPPVGSDVDTPYVHTFSGDFESFNALVDLNFSTEFGSTVTAGVNFDYGFVEPIGSTTFTVTFTQGIANRLGFLDSETYTVTDTTKSNFPPIVREPMHFVLIVNGEKVAVIYPDKNFEFTTQYPIFKSPQFQDPTVEVIDNLDQVIWVPASFQQSFVEDYKDVDFRTSAISHYYCEEMAPRVVHTIPNGNQGQYAVKDIYIHDAQRFHGDEDLLILGHRIYGLHPASYINTDFKIASTGSPLLLDDADARRCIIVSYSKTDYRAMPVYTATPTLAYPGDPTFLQQIPQSFQLSISGTIPAISPGNLPITPSLINALPGQLSYHHYGQLTNSPVITSVNIENNNVTITSDSNYMTSFFSRAPQYIEMLRQTAINNYLPCAHGTIKGEYNFTSAIPIGQRGPSHYQLSINSTTYKFSHNITNLIEWQYNYNNPSTFDIDIESYDSNDNLIRRLDPFEFVVHLLFR